MRKILVVSATIIVIIGLILATGIHIELGNREKGERLQQHCIDTNGIWLEQYGVCLPLNTSAR